MSALSFTAEAEVLGRALREVRQVTERTNTIPILGNVLLEARDDGTLRLTCNNLTVSATRMIAATVEKAGAITVTAHRFTDVVSAMQRGSQVECKADAGAQMQVTSGRSRFRFATLAAQDFPGMPFEEVSATLDISGKLLHDVLSTVRHAISTEETRYYLNGVFVHLQDKKLRFAATDGVRLARVEIDPPAGLHALSDTIVGTEMVNLIHKATADAEGDVRIEFAGTKVRFTAGDLVITAKAVDGTYPDYARVIPKNNDIVMEIDRDELRGALSRVLLANDEKSRSVKIAVDQERALVTSATSSMDGREEVPCSALLPRGAAEYGFNGGFMRDALDALDVDTIEFHLAGPRDQALITSKARPDATLVLVPMFI